MIRTISILGELTVDVGGDVVPVPSRKQRELLAALAISRGAPRSADVLVEELWGDERGAAARKNVQVLVGRLRTLLGSPDAIRFDDRGYALHESDWHFADVEFERELQEARRLAADDAWSEVSAVLEASLGRWSGAALGTLAGADWAREHARALDHEHRAATILCNEARLRTERHDQAVVDLRQLTREHGDDLELRALLVRALFGAGRQADALAECRFALADARARDLAPEVDRFRGLERDLLAQQNQFETRRGPTLPRVPVPRHALVGREDEHDVVRARLLNGRRVTTIVGPGGTGKTRLATEVSLALRDELDDVAWIDLSPATSTDDVLATLLNAFGITSADGDPADALTQAIGRRSICIVLDNFEQVVSSASIVARIRDACPNARLLVTSRVALGIEGEDVVRLRPFELIDDVQAADAVELERLDAVRLFQTRADLVDGVMPAGADTLRDVHRICARVDGLPLGIELAAARTRLLAPREILEQLDRTFAVISSRSQEHPERHRSIDSVIAWSHDLLDASERHAFRALSLFIGGCVAEDFAHVAGLVDADAARDTLARLTSLSLAVRDSADGSAERWRMLETIGAFGRRALANDPDEHELRDRFARRMLEHAEASNTYLANATGAERRFIEERANVHAAFDWAVDHAPTVAADIFINMDRYLHTRGSMFEGDEFGQRLQSTAAESLDNVRRASVFGLAGRMAHYRGDETRSIGLLTAGIELAQSAGDARIELLLTIWRIERMRMAGDLDEAVRELEAAGSRARRLGDEWLEAMVLAQLGFTCSDLERPGESGQHFEAAIETFRRLGDGFWVENMVANLLITDLIQTGDDTALDGLAECSRRLRELHYWTYSAHVDAFRLRGALEVGRFAESAQIADRLIPAVRLSGEAILLMFTLACGSIAFLEQGRIADARFAGWESLQIAIRSRGTLFVDYSLAALACSVAAEDLDLARWITTFIDIGRLDGIFALDKHVLGRLTDTFGEISPNETADIDRSDSSNIRWLETVSERIKHSGFIPN